LTEERLTEREWTKEVLVMVTIYNCVLPDGRSTAKNVVFFIIIVPLASLFDYDTFPRNLLWLSQKMGKIF
jgi:hypothetical protein